MIFIANTSFVSQFITYFTFEKLPCPIRCVITYWFIYFFPPFFWETHDDVEIVYLLRNVDEALDRRDEDVFDGDLFSSSFVYWVFTGFNKSFSLFVSSSCFLAC